MQIISIYNVCQWPFLIFSFGSFVFISLTSYALEISCLLVLWITNIFSCIFKILTIFSYMEYLYLYKIKFWFCCCSALKSCPTLCDHMDCNMLGFPVLHCLPESAQIHVHWVRDSIQPSHPLLLSSLFAFNLSQHQDIFQ